MGRPWTHTLPWIEKTLDLKVFKLGRLQFELLSAHEFLHLHPSLDLPPQTLILNTHIQGGVPLSYTECQSSYTQAIDFYENQGHDFDQILFYCDSWLLYPKLPKLLRPQDNIIQFQKDFTLIEMDSLNPQMQQRVFYHLSLEYASYPENTRLQRNLKHALLNGESFGTAEGYFILKK